MRWFCCWRTLRIASMNNAQAKWNEKEEEEETNAFESLSSVSDAHQAINTHPTSMHCTLRFFVDRADVHDASIEHDKFSSSRDEVSQTHHSWHCVAEVFVARRKKSLFPFSFYYYFVQCRRMLCLIRWTLRRYLVLRINELISFALAWDALIKYKTE